MSMLILPTDNWPITSLHSKTTNTLSRLPTAPETRPGSFSGTTLLQRYSSWPKKSIVVGIRQNPSLPGQNVPATSLTALSVPIEKPDQYRDLEPWTQYTIHPPVEPASAHIPLHSAGHRPKSGQLSHLGTQRHPPLNLTPPARMMKANH